MNHKLPFILACGMAGVAIGLYAWDHSVHVQSNIEHVHEQTEPVIPEFKPLKREFTLDDGTRCISVSTRATHFPQDSGLSGISCDWDYNRK